MGEGARYDAFQFLTLLISHHREGFPAACLPIGEDGAVVTLDNRLHQTEHSLLVYGSLGTVRRIDRIIGEVLHVVLLGRLAQDDLVVRLVDLDDLFRVYNSNKSYFSLAQAYSWDELGR